MYIYCIRLLWWGSVSLLITTYSRQCLWQAKMIGIIVSTGTDANSDIWISSNNFFVCQSSILAWDMSNNIVYVCCTLLCNYLQLPLGQKFCLASDSERCDTMTFMPIQLHRTFNHVNTGWSCCAYNNTLNLDHHHVVYYWNRIKLQLKTYIEITKSH